MPKELTNKQQAFVDAIENSTNKQTYNNALESAREAGYKGNNRTLASVGSENLTKPNIILARQAIRAKKQARVEHNYETAITELNQVIANLTTQALAGKIPANRALIAAMAEKNNITGLHSQTIRHRDEPVPERSEAEQQALAETAHDFKLKLAQG